MSENRYLIHSAKCCQNTFLFIWDQIVTPEAFWRATSTSFCCPSCYIFEQQLIRLLLFFCLSRNKISLLFSVALSLLLSLSWYTLLLTAAGKSPDPFSSAHEIWEPAMQGLIIIGTVALVLELVVMGETQCVALKSCRQKQLSTVVHSGAGNPECRI